MIAFIEENRDIGVEPICKHLPIAPSTFYDHMAKRANPDLLSDRAKRDKTLRPEIERVWEQNYKVYGVRKVWHQMRREGFDVARCTVARLMNDVGLEGVIRGKKARTTMPDKALPCPLDKVNRQFKAPAPDILWVSDFTYVATWQGFVYVAFVIDAFARRIVGRRVSRTAHAGFVLDALEQAVHQRQPGSGLTKILKNPIYAGYVQAKKWGVSLRRGHHEPLISFATYEKIQKNLEEGARGPARADFSEDFPLRGFVTCSECGNNMTGAWSKGKYKHYAYYRCETRGCSQKSKSVARAKLEGGFEDILKRLQPSNRLLDLAIAMFKDAWNSRLELAQAERDEWRRQAEAADKSLLELIDRVVETKNATAIKAIESKIEKLEREKMLLVEKASEPLPNAGKFEECIELSLRFLSRPWDIYKNGSYAVRQTVLRLAFSDPLTYTPEGVYGTPKTTLPFKVLGGLSGKKCEMVL